MIGDLRTEALHQALADTPIEDDTLLGMLILALAGDNVTIDSSSDLRGDDRQAICRTLTEGGVLTADPDLLRQTARKMLVGVLSCRENRSRSGSFARIAGEAIGASVLLPNMATEDFLSCLSRGALETHRRSHRLRSGQCRPNRLCRTRSPSRCSIPRSSRRICYSRDGAQNIDSFGPILDRPILAFRSERRILKSFSHLALRCFVPIEHAARAASAAGPISRLPARFLICSSDARTGPRFSGAGVMYDGNPGFDRAIWPPDEDGGRVAAAAV